MSPLLFQLKFGIFHSGKREQDAESGTIIVEPLIRCARQHNSAATVECFCYNKSGRKIEIDSKKIVRRISLIHDCVGGLCEVKEGEVEILIEQQKVLAVKRLVKHNNRHNHFFVNKYRFTHLS